MPRVSRGAHEVSNAGLAGLPSTQGVVRLRSRSRTQRATSCFETSSHCVNSEYQDEMEGTLLAARCKHRSRPYNGESLAIYLGLPEHHCV